MKWLWEGVGGRKWKNEGVGGCDVDIYQMGI